MNTPLTSIRTRANASCESTTRVGVSAGSGISESGISESGVSAADESIGVEWVIDAIGCDATKLSDKSLIRSLCDRVIDELGLNVVGDPLCHQFPFPGGVTALYLLSESHFACHTYPEHSFATFNLYCCRDRDEWPWSGELAASLDASDVRVRRLPRGWRGGNDQ